MGAGALLVRVIGRPTGHFAVNLDGIRVLNDDPITGSGGSARQPAQALGNQVVVAKQEGQRARATRRDHPDTTTVGEGDVSHLETGLAFAASVGLHPFLFAEASLGVFGDTSTGLAIAPKAPHFTGPDACLFRSFVSASCHSDHLAVLVNKLLFC